jgi:hypothetical protein
MKGSSEKAWQNCSKIPTLLAGHRTEEERPGTSAEEKRSGFDACLHIVFLIHMGVDSVI